MQICVVCKGYFAGLGDLFGGLYEQVCVVRTR